MATKIEIPKYVDPKTIKNSPKISAPAKQPAKTAPVPAKNTWDNVYSFLTDTSKNVGDWFSDALTPSKELKSFMSGKDLNSFYTDNTAGKQLLSTIKDIAIEAPARAAAAGSLDVNVTGKKLPTLTPTTQAEKFLFGEEPIKPLSEQYKEAKYTLETAGFKHGSSAIAATAIFGGAILDVTAFGGSRKKLAEILAKETAPDIISKILRKANVAEDLIAPYAQKFAKITDPKQIEAGLKSLENMASTTKKAGSALGYSREVLKGGEDLIKQSEGKSATKVIGDLMTKWYDKYYNVGKFMDEIEKTIGRKLTMEENAYVGARMFSGAGGKMQNKLDNLGIILREFPENIKNGDLDTYLFNQRVIERANRGFLNPGGMTRDIANKALKELEESVGKEKFEQIQKQGASVYEYVKDLLKYIKEGGLISEKDYADALKNNQMYVPFDIIERMIQTSDNIKPGSKAFSVASQDLVKQTIGTELLTDLPTNALVRKTIKAVDLVERNKVAQTLVDLRKLSPEMGEVIKKLETGAENLPKGYGKVSVLRDGVKETYSVPADVAEAMKRMSIEQVDFLTKTASWGSQALKSGATTFNLLFLIPNAWRDAQTATMVSKVGFNVVDWLKGFWEASKSTVNKYGWKVDDGIFRKYLEDAGQIGGYYSTYLNQVPKTAKELTEPQWKKLASLLNPFKLISEAGKIIEATPRLGVYQKALSKGLSGREAGFISREATVDFAKMGEAMRVFNRWTPFINARMQGTINVGKAVAAAATNPKKAAELSLKIGALAITPFVASYYWNVRNYPEVWDDISDYDKSNYMVMIYGNHQDEDGNYDHVIKVPKGSFNFFIDPVQDFLEWQRGNIPNVYSAVASDTLFNLLPLSTTSQGSFGSRLFKGVAGLTPPPARALFESRLNTTFDIGRPIVPESMQNVSPGLQYKDSTALIAKEVGGWLGISPLKIQYAIRTMTGGLGTELLNVAGTVKEPGPKVPFAAGFEKKFTKVRGGQKEQEEIEKVQQYQTQMYDRKIIEKKSAQNLWNKIRTAQNPEEVKQIISDLGENAEIKKQLINLIGNEVTPYSTELLKTISPKERAQYLYDNIKSFKSGEEAAPFLQKMEAGGIITKDVRDQLKILMLGGQ